MTSDDDKLRDAEADLIEARRLVVFWQHEVHVLEQRVNMLARKIAAEICEKLRSS